MSLKFFSGLQDFLRQYTPAASFTAATSVSDTVDRDRTSPAALRRSDNCDNDSVKNSPVEKSSIMTQCDANPPESTNGSKRNDDDEPPAAHARSGKCVRFPSPERLVTGEWEQPRPFSTFSCVGSAGEECCLNVHEILEAYLNACKKLRLTPSAKVEKQISCFHLSKNERQEILSLRGEKISASHLDCLEEILKRVQFVNVEFEYCFLDDEAVVCLCDLLEYYDSAVRLNLSFNQNIGFRGWQALCRVLKKSPRLEQLNLRYTSLNERSIPILARTLRSSELSLTSLHLENCSLSGKSMLLLACAFKSNSSIRDLHLAENSLQPSDAAHLYHIVVNNSSLELLDLRNNHVQDSGFAHICDGLKHPDCRAKSRLNTLVLWNNRLTSRGMMHLTRVLMENKTLKTLNLGSNNICSEGIALIKESLARNQSLLRLGLQATKLANQGAIALAECIADNSGLVRLDLRSNPEIRSAGLLALHVALRMNRTLTALNLDESCAQPAGHSRAKDHQDHFRRLYQEIAQLCRRNYDLYLQRLLNGRSEEVEPEPGNDGHSSATIDAVAVRCNDQSAAIENGIPVQEMSGDKHKEDSQSDCSRKISLTCREPVENVAERFLAMPRLDESLADECEAQQNSASCSSTATIIIHSPPADPVNNANPQSSPRSSAPRRFSVSKVAPNAAKKPVIPSTAPDEKCRMISDQHLEQIVRRLLADVLTYCEYEMSSGCQALSLQLPPRRQREQSVQSIVGELLDDLLRFVEFEVDGGASAAAANFQRTGSERASFRKGPSESRETTEAALVAREVVHDLVKRVCVATGSRKISRLALKPVSLRAKLDS